MITSSLLQLSQALSVPPPAPTQALLHTLIKKTEDTASLQGFGGSRGAFPPDIPIMLEHTRLITCSIVLLPVP